MEEQTITVKLDIDAKELAKEVAMYIGNSLDTLSIAKIIFDILKDLEPDQALGVLDIVEVLLKEDY